MNAVARYCFRARLRRPGALLVLVLLVAIGVGGAGAAAAGARRTTTAVPRLSAQSSMPDAFVGATDPATLDAVFARPEVEHAEGFDQMAVQPGGVACSDDSDAYFPFYAPLAGTPFSVARPRVISGRFPDPSRVDEVAIPEQHAQRLGVGVGDEIELLPFLVDEDTGEIGGCGDEPVESVVVVGVLREPLELGAAGEPTLAWSYLTRAFGEAHPELSFTFPHGFVDLREGTDVAAFAKAVNAPPSDPEGPASFAADMGPSPLTPAMDALATGLWGLAGAIGVATLALVAAAMARQLAAAAPELIGLSDLGLGRRALTLVAGLPVLGAVVLGTLLAPLVMVGLSPLHPIGLARRVEPDPGLDVDALVLVAAVALAVLVFGAIAAALVWLAARRATRAERAVVAGSRSRTRGWLRSLPLWASTGVTFAFERSRGRAALPGRSAVVGVLAGTAGILGVLVFGVGVGHASEDPTVYGWGSWDAELASPEDSDEAAVAQAEQLADDADLAAVSQLYVRFHLTVDGTDTPGLAIDHVRGHAGPTVVDGRLPVGPDEIALGSATADALGRGLGDELEATGPRGDRSVRVVGIVALPGFDSDPISAGWVADQELLDALGFDPGCNHDDCFSPTLVEVRSDLDVEGVLDGYAAQGLDVHPPAPSGAVLLLSEADQLPGVAAGGVALVAAVGLAHTTGVTVRRRRRELGILKALGVARRSSAGILIAEATAIAVAGGVVGSVLGLALGRTAWRAAARAIGVGPELPVVWPMALGVFAAVIALALVLAVWPAVAAARLSPAGALRDE